MKKIILFVLILTMLTAQASASFVDTLLGNRVLEEGRSDHPASIFGDLAKRLTITAYSGNVPVQIGYNKVTNFWILTATVGWKYDELVLIKLDSGTKDSISSNEAAQAQKETSLKIYPMGGFSTAPLTKDYMIFSTNSIGGTMNVPFYRVEGGAWKTTTMYDAQLNSNSWIYADVSYDSPAQISLGSGAYIENLGILPNGANIPSGDFVILLDPDNNPHVVRYGDLLAAGYYWRDHMEWKVFGAYTWRDLWDFWQNNNVKPADIVLSANPSYTSNVYYICEDNNSYTNCKGGEYKKIKVKYPMTAMSSMISIYIPQALADTIILKTGGSKGTIVGTPTITSASDKQYAELKVTIRNDGGDDYISVKPTSAYYSFTAIGDNTRFVKAGETVYFVFKAYALDVVKACNKCAAINILVDGSDPYTGDSSTTIYGTIYDSDDVAETTAKLTVKALGPEKNILSNAEIYVNGEMKGKGQVTLTLSKGEYNVSSTNIDKLYAPSPKLITMNGIDQVVELQFASQPQGEDMTWVFWVVVTIIIGYTIFKSWVGQAILKSPTLLILLAVILLILWFLYKILEVVLSIADDLSSAYNSITTLGGLI